MKVTASVGAIVAALLVCLPVGASADTPPPPDAGLYTQYNVSISRGYLYWTTCGTIGSTTKCYDAGTVHDFNKAGALLLGVPSVDGNSVTRALYVLDSASGPTQDRMALKVYRRTDQITANDDIVTVELVATVNLPMAGGTSALPSMAANDGYLFIGSNLTHQVVRVDKQSLSATPISVTRQAITVSSITSDETGFVTVSWGGIDAFPNNSAIFGPDGELVGHGKGVQFQLGTRQALLPDTIP